MNKTAFFAIALIASIITGCSNENLAEYDANEATARSVQRQEVSYNIIENSKSRAIVPCDLEDILSEVYFTASTESPSMEVTVESVSLCNIKYAGTVSVPTNGTTALASDWSLEPLTEGNAFAVAENAEGSYQTITSEKQALNTEPLKVVPQTLTAWNTVSDATVADATGKYQSYLEISCVIKQNGVVLYGAKDEQGNLKRNAKGEVECAKMYIPFSASWQPGKRYNYNLVFGGGYNSCDGNGTMVLAPIQMSVTLTPWGTAAE